MSEPAILWSIAGGVARITLNRPDKRNALNAAMVAEIADALAAAAADESVRVVLLTGAGEDFCSGADLAALRESSGSGVLANLADAQAMADLILAMRRHPRPIVAAVRGRALAGGCGLATAADVILASESARFGYPEINIGFIPAIVMAILRRSVSEKRAFELIVTGEIVPAQYAYETGMITRILGDETFELEVDAWVAKLAAKSASAVSLSKHLLYHMDGLTFGAAVTSGVHLNAIARLTDDCRAGIGEFLSRQSKSRA